MRPLENFVRLFSHLRMGNVVDCRPRVDRVLILSAFRLLHLRYLVNPIPAGRLKPLFFMSFSSCPFVCLLPIATISLFRIGEDFLFFWPRCLYQLDGAKVCIKRHTGLPRIALHMPRTAFIINNSAPTRGHPIPTIPLLFSTPVLYISVCVDSLINKLYPLRTKITFDNVYFAEVRINKKCPSHTL